jgi:cytidine deaminase
MTDLFKNALKSLENAYTPYSNYPVGCAIQTPQGDVFSGGNIEIANYDGTCAEAGAIAAMHNAGQREIETLVVVGPGNDLCTPCGRCRQRIREFSLPNTTIQIFNRKGEKLRSYTMDELLPDSFGPENLKANV